MGDATSPYRRDTPLTAKKGVPDRILGDFEPNFEPEPFSPTSDVSLVPGIVQTISDTDNWAELENPFLSWNAAIKMVNSWIEGPYETLDGIFNADPGNNFLDSNANQDVWGDGLIWLGPSTMELVTKKDHVWTRDDIIAARNYRRKLFPEIVFKRIPRKWNVDTLIDLLTPWWLFQNQVFFVPDAGFNANSFASMTDRPGIVNGGGAGISGTGVAIIDLDDEQGPFHYVLTTLNPQRADAMLARWNLEDSFDDAKEPITRGKSLGELPGSYDDAGTLLPAGWKIRIVVANGIDGIVRDETQHY